MDGNSGRNTRKIFIFLFVLMFLIACGLPNGGKPTATSSPSHFTNHILVSLTNPHDGESYPISAGLSIRGEAISDNPIARMELWTDGNLYETYSAPEDGLGLLAHYWTWSPKSLGTHTLMVRAYDNQNRSSFSDVIHLTGVADPGYVLIAKAEDGDSVSRLAQRYHVPIDELLRENPNLTETALLPSGHEVFVHIDAPALAAVPSIAARVMMKLNQWSGITLAASQPSQKAVAAPSLTVSGQGCGASLTITDSSNNEKGFNIYRLKPGSISFTKLGTLPAHAGSGALSFQDTNLYGKYHYYVSAFDESEEAASNLVSIDVIDSTCGGTSTTIDNLASLPAGVEEYYLYMTINNGIWRRFPADEFVYLKSSDDLDFNQVASNLAPNLTGNMSMRGEVWGLVNGSATLLGTFDKTIKTNQAPASIEPVGLGQVLTTKLEVRGVYNVSTADYPWLTEKGTGYSQETFHFGTDTNATYGIWQVASVPFGLDASFNPACLLLSGKTNGSGTASSPFEFGIDFSSFKPKIESVRLSSFENSLEQTPIFFTPILPGKLDSPSQQVANIPKLGAGSLGVNESPVVSNLDPCAKNVSAEGIIKYYVRIIPMNNSQATGKPSNIVTITYDPKGQTKITIPVVPLPIEPYYDVKILNFTGVHVPDQLYEFCVEIVKNDNPLYPYKPGDKLCPESFKGGNNDSLLDAIESAVNFISDIYNKLSDWATELVDQLNPLCIQAKLASSAIKVGEKEVQDACHYIAVIAVTAAKTYAGLPPSLPNFDQLTEFGKENLVDLAAQELEDNGVPCPETCKDVIRKGIDASLEEVKNSMNNSSCFGEDEAHQNGIEPLCLPPGVITKPDPRGQPAPAVLEVQITRRATATGQNFPEPKSCQVNISAKATNNVVGSFQTSAGFEWNGGFIEGSLFTGNAAFPNLQAGESTKLPIILSPVSFWLPGHKDFVKKGWKPEDFDDWGILYQGATATITASGACKFEFPEGTGITDKSVSGDSNQVGPLGQAWNQSCHPYNCP